MRIYASSRIAVALLCLEAPAFLFATGYKLKLHKVVDPATKMLTGEYLIPAGWTAKDEITWMPLNYGTPCVGKSTITSPDGKLSLVRVSAISVPYGQSTYGRSGTFPPDSVATLLAQLWAKDHPGLNARIIARQDSPVERHSGQYDTYGYDGTVKLAFDQDGEHMLVKGYGRIDGFQLRPVGAAMVMEGRWTISNIIGVTAPAEKLESAMKLYAICIASYRLDPHFFSVCLQVQQWSEQHAYRESENALNLSRHLAQNQTAISADIMSVYRNRSKAMDSMNQKFDDYIRGVETYTDSRGNKVNLPDWHAHLYSDGVGDYYYSDKPGGSPGNYSEMKRQ